MRHLLNILNESLDVRAYHGTLKDFDAFDVSKAGTSNWTSQIETGAIWAAQDPQVAAAFAGADVHGRAPDGAQVMPLRLHMANPLIVDLAVEGPRFRSDAYFNHPKHGRLWNVNPVKEYFVAKAKREGHDGVVFTNGYDGWMAKGDIYAVFSPSQVKMMHQEAHRSLRHYLKEAEVEEANVIGTAVSRREIPARYKQYPVIGQGSTSLVLEKDPNTVLVLTRDTIKADWLQYIEGKFIERFESHYNPTNFGIGQHFDITVIETPKLFPLSPENKKLLRRQFKEFEKVYTAIRMAGVGWGKNNHHEELARHNALRAAMEHFEEHHPDSEILGVLNWAGNYDTTQYDFDFLMRNFMQDASGKIIAVDPVVSRELAKFLNDMKIKRYQQRSSSRW